MKKIFGIVLSLFIVTQLSYAQGEKSLKMASKSFSQFSSDPFGNTAALDEAKAHLEEAFKDAKVSSSAKAWITRGDIYYNSGDAQMKGKLLNPDAELTEPMAGIKALESYSKALELAEKKGDIKKAVAGLENTENLLNNVGVELYKVEDYLGSYENFKAELETSKLLKANGKASRLDAEGLLSEKLFFAGLTAFYAKEYDNSINYMKEANGAGYSDATVYQLIYESYRAMDKSAEGVSFLEEGREKFPDDSGLLFSEINHYLASGELDQMIGKLEYALEREPDNESIIVTLGQVYDQLQVKSNEAGDTEKAAEYFQSALNYYSKALEKSPEDFDLNYSMGALYYNKAAGLTPAFNEAANDFSKAGEKLYNELKDKMAGLFNQALPYFLKADSINGSDRNTLIALKEIFARQDNFEKSNEYKVKLEDMESGQE